MSSYARKNPSTVKQSLETVIQRLKLQQLEQIEAILAKALIKGDLQIYYLEGVPLPFRAKLIGWTGHGDTISESMAQLANKLALPMGSEAPPFSASFPKCPDSEP